MRICWFNDNRLGLVEGDKVKDVSAALRVLPAPRYPAEHGDLLIAHLDAVRAEIAKVAGAAPAHDAKDVSFLSPVANPGKIIGVPVNYLKHVEEAEAQRDVFTHRYQGSIREQGLFLKATSALVGTSHGVKINHPDRRTDHEIELGVVIGRKVYGISEAEALSCVAGYSVALDMVLRGPEDRSYRKSPDTYAVLGPWLVTADEIADPGKLDLSLQVNGVTKQSSNTEHFIMDLPKQIAWAASVYTLYPGDIIMTGTCEGVSPVVPGDVMRCHVEKIATVDVKVF